MTRPKKLAQPATPDTTGDRTDAPIDDLGALAMRQTATVPLTDPRYPGKNIDSGYRILIESYYSQTARDIISGARASLQIVKGEVDDTDEAEDADRSFSETLPEQLIAVTRRWWKEGKSTDTITLNGVTMQATPENVRKVYEDPEFSWMRNQVQRAYLQLSVFFEPPKTA